MLRVQNANCKVRIFMRSYFQSVHQGIGVDFEFKLHRILISVQVICSVVNCLTSTLEIFTCDGSEERELVR